MSSSGSNTGTSGSDTLNGGSGDDLIDGGAGSDRISSGSGNDTLDGGSGSDTLNAGSGNDTLVYNVGENAASGTKDVYTGGAGIDTLVIEFTSAEWGNDAYREQIGDFLTQLAQVTNAKTGEVSNGSGSDFSFNFGGSTLTLQMTENLQVFVDGVKVLDSTDKQAAALQSPDLSAASDSGVSSTDNVTNDDTPTFTGSGAEPLATVKLYAGTTLVGTTVAGLDGTWSVTSAALGEGVHQLSVVQVDLMGNVSAPSAAASITIDTTAPVAPASLDLAASDDSGSSSSDDVTNHGSGLTVGGGGESGAKVTVFDDVNGNGQVDAGEVLATTTVVDGSFSVDVSLGEGLHHVRAVQTDVAGNTSAASGTLALTIDTQAAQLAAPDLDAGSDSGSSSTDDLTRDGTPTVKGGGAEAGATVSLYDTDGTTLLGTATADASGNWSITSSALADGSHSLAVTQTDVAGNTSVLSPALAVTIDTQAAQLATPDLDAASDSGSSSTDDLTRDGTPTVKGGGAEAGATVSLYDTDGTTLLGTATADASGNWSITSSALADGSHSLAVTQTDVAGNTSVLSPALAVTIDTQAAQLATPDLDAASDSGSSSTDDLTRDGTPTVKGGGAEAGATVSLYDTDGTTLLGTATADASGNWSITSSALADGSHSLAVTQTDVAGNTSVLSPALAVTIDTQAAQLAAPDLDAASDSGSSSTDDLTRDGTPTVKGGGAEAGATVSLYEGAALLGSAVANGDGTWSIASSSLSDGTHDLTVKQTDVAGNTSAASAALSVTIDTQAQAPAITSVTDDVAPTTGPVANDGTTNDTTPTLAGLAEANSTVTIHDGAVVLGTASADAAGAWTFTTAALAEGAHAFSASVTDVAGNTSDASPVYAVNVTTNHAPTDITLNAANIGNAIPTAGVAIASLSTADADAGDTFTYTLGGANAAAFSINGSSLTTAVNLAQGTTYQVSITSSDPHGASYTEGFRLITGTNAGGGDTTSGGSDDASAYNGDDVLLAGNGGSGTTNVDVLFGLGGNDLLYGQGGRDQLHGGLGNDVLQGGDGNDTFYFETALSSTLNVDRIVDFNADNPSNGADKIQLSNAVFGLGTTGNLSAADYGTVDTGGSGDLSGKSVGAGVNVVFDATTGALYYDADGGGLGNAQLFAFVTVTAGTLESSDILLGG